MSMKIAGPPEVFCRIKHHCIVDEKYPLHNVHWGLNPPLPPPFLKNTTSLFLAKPPLKSANSLSLHLYIVFRDPPPLPLKSRIFQ